MTNSSNQRDSLFSAVGRARRPFVLAALFLVYLVLTLFLPVLNYEFVDLDTPAQLLDNPAVHGLAWKNVTAILAGEGTTSSYYPVRSLTYALDYTIWGLNPMGFKLTNVLVHLANGLLLFRLVLRLFRRSADTLLPKSWFDASIAGFAAGIFAIHPVVVEPVAWVPGREELLMVFWTLGCFHCYLTARKRGTALGDGNRSALPWYVAATACCLFACLSNAVGAVIPLLITAWDGLTLGRRGWKRILCGTAALWLIGCLVIAKKQAVEQHDLVREMQAKQVEQIAELIEELGYGDDMSVGELPGWSQTRLMLVLNLYWKNVVSLAWPSKLAISYETVTPRVQGILLGLAALAVTLLAMWMLRKRKTALFGFLWFGLALGPASQIMTHHIHRADRFLYLPLVGLAIVIAMSLRPLSRFLGHRAMVFGGVAVGLATLLALYATSARQVRTWRNTITTWENSVRIGPKNFLAQRILADKLAKAGDYERAYRHFEEALKINAYNIQALNQFAGHLATNDDESQRDYELAIRLASWACELSQRNDPESVHTLAVVYNNYAVHLGAKGENQQAIDFYAKAIETDPGYAAPLFNLALLRNKCSDAAYRRPEEAVRLAERACRLAADPSGNELMILAMAYAQTGQADRAVATVERALTAAEASGDVTLAGTLRERLELFRGQATTVAPGPVP
jgi:tetratricopeptide (TPR) repeat protein